MALVAVCGFRRCLGTGKSLSFVGRHKMPTSEISPLIAWWGAGLSTLLAFVKIWELWRDRLRIEVDYRFATDPNVGNSILIRNLSSRPLILSW
jgi:hypothetical protein